MKSSAAWAGALLALASSISLDDARAAASATEARRNLQVAMEDLTKAVKRIEKDPPSPEDLSAAERAVEVLRGALEAGAAHEAQDLEYAKTALAARKELRTGREYVERRVAQGHLHERRRLLDRSVADLDESLQALRSAGVGPRDFDRAQRAAVTLEAELTKAQALASQDEAFGRHLTETRSKLQRAQREVEERQVQLAVQAQVSKLGTAKGALDAALPALSGQEVTDAQFDAADRAVTELEAVLEAGQALLPKDQGYRTQATQMSEIVRRARKAIEERWGEAGLARLRAELGPAHEDLTRASRLLAGRSPSAEVVAEARTAAIVVQKLLEKSAHLAKRGRSAAQYLGEVEKTWLAVRVDLQRRQLEPARAAVNAALKTLAGRAVEEKRFLEADQTVHRAREILREGEGLEPLDRAYAGYTRELRKSLDEASARILARRAELERDRQKAAVEKARAELSRALMVVERRAPTPAQFEAAHTAAIALEKTIAASAGLQDRDLQSYLSQMRSVLQASRRSLDARQRVVEGEAQQARVTAGLRTLERSLAALDAAGPSAPALAAADDALNAATMDLEAGVELEQKLSVYRTWVKPARRTLELSRRRLAKKRLQFTVAKARVELESAVLAARAALGAASQPAAPEGELESARRRVKELGALLEEHAPLEAQDSSHAKLAARVRAQLGELGPGLALAERAATFQKTVVPALDAGTLAAQNGADSRNLQLSRDEYQKAVDQLQACQRRGEEQLDAEPRLGAVIVLAERAGVAAKEVIAQCKARHEAAAEGLRKVSGRLAFHEGPARAYQAASSLLSQAQGASGEARARHLADALSQFEECISSGKILQYKNPELQGHEFELGAGKVTLAQLVATCIDEAKKLRAK